MRLVTMRMDGSTVAGRLEGDQVVQLEAPDVGALLASGDGWQALASADGPRHTSADVDLAPVVPHPSQIFCLGLNYADHIAEMGHEQPRFPTLFAKFPSALTGPRDPLVLPSVSSQVDWEVELAIVVGRRARRVDERDALDAIAGYSVLNDVSMRDWQGRTTQFLQGKTFEGCTPVGPALVTADELPGASASALGVRCEVDGVVMQESSTSNLIFGAAACISYISQFTTLQPGDLIATGTPGGVGAGRRPQVFLRPGQTLRTVIEGVGELVNACVEEQP